MSESVKIPGFESKTIELASGWSYKVMVDGQQAPKGAGKQEYLITDDNGEQKTVVLKPQGLDLPVIEFNGETYRFAKPVGMGAKVFLGVLLFPLLLAGGAIGGALAGVGFVMSMKAFRSDKADWLQFLIGAAYAAGAWVTWFIMAIGIQMLIN